MALVIKRPLRLETCPGFLTVLVKRAKLSEEGTTNGETQGGESDMLLVTVYYGSRYWKTTKVKSKGPEGGFFDEGFVFKLDGSPLRRLNVGLYGGGDGKLRGFVKLDLQRLVRNIVPQFNSCVGLFSDDVRVGDLYISLDFRPDHPDVVPASFSVTTAPSPAGVASPSASGSLTARSQDGPSAPVFHT